MSPLLSMGQQAFYYSVQVPVNTPDAAASSMVSPAQAEQLQNSDAAENSQKVPLGRRDFDTYECQTCKRRKYQDGSDDPGVSFKTPTHISPENAPYAIRSHEMEHVSHAQSEAQRKDREIVSQSVTYHTAICPECGRVYMSGGTTRTMFREARDAYNENQEQKGKYLDWTA